jgi:probable blue pigment (indigoidine) exporter
VTTLGILNIGAFFALLFASAYHLPGGVAATLGAIQPLIVAGLSHSVLAERFTRRSLATGVIGMLGIAILVLRSDAALSASGVVAGLLGAASMAWGVVLAKKWGRPPGMTNIAHTGWMLTTGGAVLVPLMAAVEGLPASVDGRNMAGFGYLILVNTALAYVLWMRGISQLPATQITYLGLLSPITATLVGWAALDEALTSMQLLGLALALGSVLAAQGARPSVRCVGETSDDTELEAQARPAVHEASIAVANRT